jgi:hypothetical protein
VRKNDAVYLAGVARDDSCLDDEKAVYSNVYAAADRINQLIREDTEVLSPALKTTTTYVPMFRKWQRFTTPRLA